MDYSAANTALWNIIIQLGIIAGAVMVSAFLREKIAFLKRSLLPVAVLAGFLMLALKYIGLINLNTDLLELLVYHSIAMGFIAMSLRVPDKHLNQTGSRSGLKSGALIVSTYLVQAVTGLLITIILAYTFMPDMFKAAGILLPMGYGQGPGQANNVGGTYEALGFVGGRSFGLAIAASGYLCACIVGVIMLNILVKKGKINTTHRDNPDEHLSVSFFQDKQEIPISESIDKLSVQVFMVLFIYLLTYLVTLGVTSGISAISEGLAGTVNTLLWGFNFIIGSALAMLIRVILEAAKKAKLIERQYQNNYLLNRISGFFFDIMIVAGIASIKIEDLSGLWVPFVLISVMGGLITWLWLSFACKKAYKDYYYEGLMSMYGMLTGTIGSGILLLREIDPDFKTPAANNLVTGSSFGILFGAPVLVLVGLAAKSDLMCFVTLGLAAVYWIPLAIIVLFLKPKKKKETDAAE